MLTSDSVGTAVGSNSSQLFGSIGIQTRPEQGENYQSNTMKINI